VAGTGEQGLIRMFVLDTNHVSELTYRTAAGLRLLKRLSTDLGEAFPDMKGFSTRNLKYMKFFAEYQLVRALPEPLDTCLPSIEQIEAELGRIGEEES
jgi:hypothetical protein